MEPEQPSIGPGQPDTQLLPEDPDDDNEESEKPKRVHRPALLARFPRLSWFPAVDDRWPDDPRVVKGTHLTKYQKLAGDLQLWLDQVEPRFRRLDHRARILQNQFWRQHLALIFGGLVATTLGAVQAAVGGGVVGLAVAQAVLAGVLAGLTVLVRSRRSQQRFLTTRLRAEQVKSEFFLFLARAGAYAADDRVARLTQQVDDIEAAEGAT